MTSHALLLKRILFLALACAMTMDVTAQEPGALVQGLDHIPVVVRDLEQAQADYRALGFAIKPGRPHADGVRNAHVKFPDGTEIELITASRAVDALTSEYRDKLLAGEGPVYFGMYAPDQATLAARLAELSLAPEREDGLIGFEKISPLHPLFFGTRNKSPTDQPQHFAHANTAVRLTALWVRARPEETALFGALGVPLRSGQGCGPFHGEIEIAKLPEGKIMLVQSSSAEVLAAQVAVRRLATLRSILKAHAIKRQETRNCGAPVIWVPPSEAHGIWLEFVKVP